RRLRTYLRAIVQGARNGGDSHPGPLCHVFDGHRTMCHSQEFTSAVNSSIRVMSSLGLAARGACYFARETVSCKLSRHRKGYDAQNLAWFTVGGGHGAAWSPRLGRIETLQEGGADHPGR